MFSAHCQIAKLPEGASDPSAREVIIDDLPCTPVAIPSRTQRQNEGERADLGTLTQEFVVYVKYDPTHPPILTGHRVIQSGVDYRIRLAPPYPLPRDTKFVTLELEQEDASYAI